MQVKRVVAGIYGANCYIIMDEDTKEALVLDPGGDVDDIMKGIEELDAKIKYIFLTHGHVDHTSGVELLKNLVGNPKVGISEKDSILINKGTHLYGPLLEGKDPEIFLKEGDEYKIGSMKIKCVETPGHTPGGMSFIIGDSVFTGDTLFYGSIGRTDLEGGNQEQILNSIRKKLLILDNETIVYPGHSRQSTIGNEKQINPFIK